MEAASLHFFLEKFSLVIHGQKVRYHEYLNLSSVTQNFNYFFIFIRCIAGTEKSAVRQVNCRLSLQPWVSRRPLRLETGPTVVSTPICI